MVSATQGKTQLKAGQILGSAILFQNDVKLLWKTLDEQGMTVQKMTGGATNLTAMQVRNVNDLSKILKF